MVGGHAPDGIVPPLGIHPDRRWLHGRASASWRARLQVVHHVPAVSCCDFLGDTYVPNQVISVSVLKRLDLVVSCLLCCAVAPDYPRSGHAQGCARIDMKFVLHTHIPQTAFVFVCLSSMLISVRYLASSVRTSGAKTAPMTNCARRSCWTLGRRTLVLSHHIGATLVYASLRKHSSLNLTCC